MTIEIKAIERDRKYRHRYVIYGEGEEPLLSVHEDLLISHRLLKGQTFTEDQLEKIRNEDQRYRAYALGVGYLGLKARTKKQIEQYLTRKELEPEHIAYALERLETEQIVDDDEYAQQFAKQRIRSGLKGRRWIKQELQQRGVSSEAAAKALGDIDREDELAAAVHAAAKKWRSLKGEQVDRRRKLIGFLMRRGFPGDVIQEAVKATIEDAELDELEDDNGLLLDN